jgi:hypothetical protein
MTEAEIMAVAYRWYVGGLIAVAAFAIVGSRVGPIWRGLLALPPLQRTATAVLGNWIVNTAFVIVTGIHDPASWFIVTDALSARIVLHQPAARAQAAIGAVYMAQILMHCVYLVSDPAIAEPRYWQVLIALAFVQLIVLGGWTIGHHWRRSHRRGGRGVAGLADADGAAGMVE